MTRLHVLGARIVPDAMNATGLRVPPEPVDVLVSGGRVERISRAGAPRRVGGEHRDDTTTLAADGRWLIPGLWDQHVHMTQWAELSGRLPLAGVPSPEAALELVAARMRELAEARAPFREGLVGVGFRASEWGRGARVAELDAVTGGRPTVLISGDAHSGWLNTAALAFFGVPQREGPLTETEWFEVFPRLPELPTSAGGAEARLGRAMEDAAALGVVGITDFEFGAPWRHWPGLAGCQGLRVRAGFYEHDLDAVLETGLRTGDSLTADGRVTLGPLKIISDGALGTLTAYCCEPYGAADGVGTQNLSPERLRELLGRAAASGHDIALHAIGDRAVSDALDAFAASGARGSLEHAQLMLREDIGRMARLGVTASVQPAHLLDDHPVMDRVWADRADRAFMLRSMRDAGVSLSFGSDAPVAPLDPWLAMDAAVRRAAPGEAPWHPSERLAPSDALFASTGGAGPVSVGSRGDLVLLDHDPLTTPLREVRVAATAVGAEVAYSAL